LYITLNIASTTFPICFALSYSTAGDYVQCTYSMVKANIVNKLGNNVQPVVLVGCTWPAMQVVVHVTKLSIHHSQVSTAFNRPSGYQSVSCNNILEISIAY